MTTSETIQDITYKGRLLAELDVDIVFEVEGGEPAGWHSPGYDACATDVIILYNNRDITDFIDDKSLEWCEDIANERLPEMQADYESRYIDMKIDEQREERNEK